MTQQTRLRGAIVIPLDDGVHGVAQLLTYHERRLVDLDYYSHPYDVNVDKAYDFVLVLTVPTFEMVIKFYDAKRRDLPLVVHVDTPEMLDYFDHARAYPGINVLAVPRATLDYHDPDVTLELHLVSKIMAHLGYAWV